jgi:hypothetical protein
MIVVTNPWAASARQLAALAHRAVDSEPPVEPAVLADAMRVLVWLAGERVAPPHRLGRGAGGVVHFHWSQGRSGFEIRVVAEGRLDWRAHGLADDGVRTAGRKLDREASSLLRSLIPISRPFRPSRDGDQ